MESANDRWFRLAFATAFSPLAILPVLALWILVGRIDAVADVVNGERYFFEALVRYLTFVIQWTFIGLPIAYVATIFYGLPVYLTLARFKKNGLGALISAGAIAGGVLALILNFNFLGSVALVVCGVAVAATAKGIIK